jgi:hypothetical protein
LIEKEEKRKRGKEEKRERGKGKNLSFDLSFEIISHYTGIRALYII